MSVVPDTNFEIDLLGKNGKKIELIGECKFKKAPFSKDDYDALMDKIKYLPATNPVICIFSLGGFTQYVQDNARGCFLIGIEELYR